MAKKGYRVPQEIKQEILKRISTDGISVKQAAEEHGVSTVTIYSWLGTRAKSTVSTLAHNKLKKENKQLKELIGELTIKLSTESKKGF